MSKGKAEMKILWFIILLVLLILLIILFYKLGNDLVKNIAGVFT
jgi:hypothetical protein